MILTILAIILSLAVVLYDISAMRRGKKFDKVDILIHFFFIYLLPLLAVGLIGRLFYL